MRLWQFVAFGERAGATLMPTFKVTLHRRIHRPGELPVNPFLAGIPAPGRTIEMHCRTWEFGANSEKEVRRMLDEAYEKDIPAVRGYVLRSIERVTEDQPSSEKVAP